MMLVELEPPWDHALTAEQIAVIESHAINNPRCEPHEKGGLKFDWGQTLLLSVDQLHLFDGWVVKRTVDNGSTRALGAFGQRNTTVVNERCNVAVAGLGLLTVNEVAHHNDLCTDRLQAMLDEGWRILAVCVQPDQRRPDYILGRTVQEEGAR